MIYGEFFSLSLSLSLVCDNIRRQHTISCSRRAGFWYEVGMHHAPHRREGNAPSALVALVTRTSEERVGLTSLVRTIGIIFVWRVYRATVSAFSTERVVRLLHCGTFRKEYSLPPRGDGHETYDHVGGG